jgi:hypothetical protein
MVDENFKLPGSSYDEVCRIIQGYGHAGSSASLENISQLTKMNPAVVSRNNKFLSSLGIIDGGNLKNITPLGQKLALGLEYDNKNEIAAAWKEIVLSNEFLTKMLTAIRIRKTMDIASFQSHIAYSAGQPKKSSTMTGAKVIIDILRTAELITEKDDQLIAEDINNIRETVYSKEDRSEDQNVLVSTSKIQTSSNMPYVINTSEKPNLSINIEIRIDVKPQELDNLGQKIRQLIKDIKNESPLDNDEGVTNKD